MSHLDLARLIIAALRSTPTETQEQVVVALLNEAFAEVNRARVQGWEQASLWQRQVAKITWALDMIDEADVDKLCERIRELRAAEDRAHERSARALSGRRFDPRVTLAECAAWAEAIVVALEAEGLTMQRVYGDALCLARSTATRSHCAVRTSLASMRWLVLAEARAGQIRIARAYSTIITVRMFAAEAARRER